MTAGRSELTTTPVAGAAALIVLAPRRLTRYPVTGRPPSSAGAVHRSETPPVDASALRCCGAVGGAPAVRTLSAAAGPVPIALIADTDR